MVNDKALLDATFSALADPTRRAILEQLGRRPTTVSELARPFDISLPAISKHLRVLEHAGLIRRERAGRQHICHLAADPMRQAQAWLERYREFWEERLDALQAHVEQGGP